MCCWNTIEWEKVNTCIDRSSDWKWPSTAVQCQLIAEAHGKLSERPFGASEWINSLECTFANCICMQIDSTVLVTVAASQTSNRWLSLAVASEAHSSQSANYAALCRVSNENGGHCVEMYLAEETRVEWMSKSACKPTHDGDFIWWMCPVESWRDHQVHLHDLDSRGFISRDSSEGTSSIAD